MPSAEVRTRARGVAASLSWVLLIVVVTIVVWASVRPPAAVPATAAATEFSSARAMQVLEPFTQRPHPVGSADHERVQQYLVEQMQALGLEPVVETHTSVEGIGHTAIAARVSNLVGRLKGTDNTRAVMLVAHYDSVDRAPGAGDDGGGVATILETVRALEAGPRLKNDVIVLLTDGEELGLLGARAATANDPWLQQVGVMFNFEGRGDQGPSAMFETSGGNRKLIEEFVKVAPYKSGSSLLYTIYQHMPNDTDYTVFKKAGVPGMNFAWTERLEAYHSRLDTPGNLDQRGLQQDGSYALTLTRAFGDEDLTELQLKGAGDEVYFDVFGMWMVHYPGAVVGPLAVLLTLALVVVLVLGVRRGELGVVGLLRATGASLLLVVAVTLTTVAIYYVEDGLFSKRLLVGDVPANTWLFAGTLLFGLAAGLAISRFFRERWGMASLAAGGCLLVCVLTLGMTWTLPTASYLFFWPLVFATVNLAVLLARKRGGGEPVGWAWLSALPTLLLVPPTIYFFFVGLELSMPTAVLCGLLVGIGLLVTVPLASVLVPNGVPLGMLVLAGVAAIAGGGVLSRPTAWNPKPDTLVYRLDADSGKAEWASLDKATDAWTAKLLTGSPGRGKLTFEGPAELDALVANAPALGLAAPEMKVTSSSLDGDVRTVQLQVTSARKAAWLYLRLGSAEVLGAAIDGQEVPNWPAKAGGSAPARGAWALDLFGYNATGVSVSLKLKGQACSATLMDKEYGLPGMVEPRPEDRMAWYGSDYTIVTRQVSIC